MDYSLLVGINFHAQNKEVELQNIATPKRSDLSLSCVKGTDTNTYIFGIIDILQEYNFSKKVEHYSKVICTCKDGHGISAVEPDEYWQRFNNQMSTHLT